MNVATVRHPVFARLYPRMSRAMDEGGLVEHLFPQARSPFSFHILATAHAG